MKNLYLAAAILGIVMIGIAYSAADTDASTNGDIRHPNWLKHTFGSSITWIMKTTDNLMPLERYQTRLKKCAVNTIIDNARRVARQAANSGLLKAEFTVEHGAMLDQDSIEYIVTNLERICKVEWRKCTPKMTPHGEEWVDKEKLEECATIYLSWA